MLPQVKLSLAISGGYYLFYLLYYLLLLAREVERIALNRSEWQQLLGITYTDIDYNLLPILGTYSYNQIIEEESNRREGKGRRCWVRDRIVSARSRNLTPE